MMKEREGSEMSGIVSPLLYFAMSVETWKGRGETIERGRLNIMREKKKGVIAV